MNIYFSDSIKLLSIFFLTSKVVFVLLFVGPPNLTWVWDIVGVKQANRAISNG